METHNKIDALVFLADTPQGVNYKNIVRTDSYYVGLGFGVVVSPSLCSKKLFE